MGGMNWRELWVVAVGDEPPVQHFHPILATITLYLLAMSLCYVMYRLSFFLPAPIRSYAVDFFTTLAFCSYPLGHVMIRQSYGGTGYMLVFVPLIVVTLYLFSQGSGSPLDLWMNFLKKSTSLVSLLTHVPIQILAGVTAFRLRSYIYVLDFHSTFATDLENPLCNTDLKTSLLVGFLVETIGVIFVEWLGLQTLSKVNVIDLIIKVANCAAFVNLGIGFTGMYMHPVMASGLTFGCEGTDRWEHLLVYWVGPFLGCFLAFQINKVVQIPLASRWNSLVGSMVDTSKQNGYSRKVQKNSSENTKKQVRHGRKHWY